MIFSEWKCWFWIKISLKFVPNAPINNIPSLVQIMAWRRPGHKPLSEPIMVSLLTHICVTRAQWVKYISFDEDWLEKVFIQRTKFSLSYQFSKKFQNSNYIGYSPRNYFSLANLIAYLVGHQEDTRWNFIIYCRLPNSRNPDLFYSLFSRTC